MGTGWKVKKRTHSLLIMLVVLNLIMFFSSVSSEYCSAKIGEEGMKMELETSTRSRFLLGGKVISPGALRPDSPFCGPSGLPYASSCLPPPSNPHDRGCSKIYRFGRVLEIGPTMITPY